MRPLAAIFRPGSCLTTVFPRNTGFGQSLAASIWDRPYGTDLAERIHTEQSTGALATIAAATDSLELAL
jgi:hypothetical protein